MYTIVTSTVYATKLVSTPLQMSEYSPKDVERMKQGKVPVGEDGHPVELHHEEQKPNGELKEMTRTEHRGKGNYSKNHPNGNKSPSKIDRTKFAKERREYWKNKAKGLE